MADRIKQPMNRNSDTPVGVTLQAVCALFTVNMSGSIAGDPQEKHGLLPSEYGAAGFLRMQYWQPDP